MAITMVVKVLLSVALILHGTTAASFLDQPANDYLQRIVKSEPNVKKQIIPDQALTDLLNEIVARASPKTAPELNKALTKEIDLATDITNLQTAIDEALTFVIDLVLPNIVNKTTIIQDDLVVPLLNLVDELSGLIIVQAITQVYAVVVSVQTVLTTVNGTLTVIDTGATSAIETLTIAQTVINAIFDFILGIV